MKSVFWFICLSLISLAAHPQWTWQNPLPQGNSLSSVHFTDTNTGYTIGDYGTIIKTINGGSSWTIVSSGTTNSLISMYFTDINTGYLVGDSGTILKTINGGLS